MAGMLPVESKNRNTGYPQNSRNRICRRAILALLALLGFGQVAGGQGLYSIDTITTIEITFEQSNWDEILNDLYFAGDEERLLATAVVGGVPFDSVGVRYKGCSSYDSMYLKKPLNIKLDYLIEDQKIDGYGTLKLANGYMDPIFIREVLAYEIARKYMPASEANFSKVYINGEYMGLYTSVQDVDEFFMRGHFHAGGLPRFKGELTCGDDPHGIVVWGYNGPDAMNYMDYYEIESDTGWYSLVDFLDVFNNNPTAVENVLNVDQHLWMLAFDNLTVNLDAPINFAHNYYLFMDGAGRFNPIIWDLNECFGVMKTLLSTGELLSTAELQRLNPFLHADSDPEYPIVYRILSNTSYRKIYIAHMKTIMEENFSNGWYLSRALEIQDIIDEEILLDEKKFYSYEDFISNVNNSVLGKVGLSELMETRLDYLENLPEFMAPPPVIAEVFYPAALPGPGSDVWIKAAVSNTAQVQLGFRTGITDRFEKVEMLDDGQHDDGAAGDGIFGVLVHVESSDLHFYIYAENADAAAFSPRRAEFEYYALSVDCGVVINEFMADNVSCIKDASGEYDDWLELYNGGPEAVNMGGFYLSDDTLNPAKWALPDTIMEPGTYLLVWADNDREQEGLHANFGLSATGESLFLTNPGLTVIDGVSFGTQNTDVSHGRAFDGSEDWISFEIPTPNQTNQVFTNPPPVIEETGHYPAMPRDTDLVNVTCLISDDAAIAMAELFYGNASGYVSLPMYDDGEHGDGAAGDSVYGAYIPPFPNETIVSYYIRATDNNGSETFDPFDPNIYKYEYQVAVRFLRLYINEVMAENDTTIQDPDGGGGYPDWIELYNDEDSAVDLSGMYLTDNLENSIMWPVPSGVTIGPGEFLLFWADNDPDQGDTHTNFKLSSLGESVGLFAIINKGTTEPIDMVTFGPQASDISCGRYPDGSDNWAALPVPTPGAANFTSTCGDVNRDGSVNVGDAVTLIDYIFSNGQAPNPIETGDVNCDEKCNVGDAVYLVKYIFQSSTSPEPCAACPD